MALPLLAAGAAVARYIASKGIRKAIKKYGEKAVMAAGKNRRTATKAEKTAGRGGNVPTRKPNVQGSKMPGGTRMPPNKLDVKAAQAARRKANEAAQMGRGKSRIKKGAGAVGAAGTAYGVGEGVGLGAFKGKGSSANDAPESYNQKRRRRIRERAAIAKKEMLKPTPPVTPKGETEKERAKKMSTSTTVTAPRSAVKKTRESMSGPSARPASKLAGPPTPPKSDLKSSGTSTVSKGNRRTPTAAIVGEKSTGAPGARDNPKTVGGAKKRGSDTFIGKDGRKKAAVTKEDLEKSGLSLRDYLNKQRGLTRRKPNKKAKGGKVKTYKNGGTVRGAGKATKGIRPCKIR